MQYEGHFSFNSEALGLAGARIMYVDSIHRFFGLRQGGCDGDGLLRCRGRSGGRDAQGSGGSGKGGVHFLLPTGAGFKNPRYQWKIRSFWRFRDDVSRLCLYRRPARAVRRL